MTVSAVQTKTGRSAANSGGTDKNTVTFDAAATAGNLLIVAYVNLSGLPTLSNPTNSFAQLTRDTASRSMSSYWIWKVAAGGETDVVIDNSSGNAIEYIFLELEIVGDVWPLSPLDQVAEDSTYSSTPTTSGATGTTAALASATGYAVSFFGMDTGNGWDTGRSYTNGSTEFAFRNGGTAPGVLLGGKQLASASAFSETLSTTDTGDDLYGAVAVFLTESGGGGTEYTLAASGGATFSGTAGLLKNISTALAASGAVAFSGTAGLLKNISTELAAGGTVAFSGTAGYVTEGPLTHILAASGGFALSGAADQDRERAIGASGAASFSGTAAYETSSAGSVVLAASGGFSLSGESILVRGKVLQASGGPIFVGDATPLTFILTMDSGGEVTFLGAAPLNFQSILGGNARQRPLTGVGQ